MNVTLLMGLALAIGAPAPKDPPKSDNKIVGEWVVESIQTNGNIQPLGDEPIRFQFTADGKWFIYHGDKKSGGDGRRYAVNSKASPATIDLDPAPNSKKNFVLPGIYQIEGDTLIICRAETSRGLRPTSFEPTTEAGTAHYVYKRVKPKE